LTNILKVLVFGRSVLEMALEEKNVMDALIARIASYLVAKWGTLSSAVKWAIQVAVGGAIVRAVERGYDGS
jgi:hypothetical protein